MAIKHLGKLDLPVKRQDRPLPAAHLGDERPQLLVPVAGRLPQLDRAAQLA